MQRARTGTFDDDVQRRDVVVDDPEADAFIVQPRRDVQVGARGLEQAAGMIVEQHLALLSHAGQGEHRVDRAACHHARVRQRAVGIGAHDERHFAPVRRGDLLLQQSARGRRQALDAHVLSSFFFAAGNRTLFKIKR